MSAQPVPAQPVPDRPSTTRRGAPSAHILEDPPKPQNQKKSKALVPLLPGSPPRPYVRALAVHAFEAVSGSRPLQQLLGWISPRVFDHLSLMTALYLTRHRHAKRLMRLVPVGGPVHLSMTRPGVCEAVVTLHFKSFSRAVSMRLEFAGTRWRAT